MMRYVVRYTDRFGEVKTAFTDDPLLTLVQLVRFGHLTSTGLMDAVKAAAKAEVYVVGEDRVRRYSVTELSHRYLLLVSPGKVESDD